MNVLRKITSIFEILGVITIGWVLTRIVTNLLGFGNLEEKLNQVIESRNPVYFEITQLAFFVLSIQFLCLIIPALLLNKFLRKWTFFEIGVTQGNVSLKDKMTLGIALFCLFGLFMKLFLLTHHFVNLGQQPTYWSIFQKDWNLGFWIFMAVGSYLFIPIFEELFYRGYCQGRLEKEFGFFAVILASILFTSIHFQYYIFDSFNIGMIVSLLLLSFAMGLSIFITRSILPAIIIHALMNIPVSYPFDWFVIGTMLIAIFVLRKTIRELLVILKDKIKEIELIPNSIFLLPIVFFALGMSLLPEITMLFVVLLFLTSIGLQIWSQKKLIAVLIIFLCLPASIEKNYEFLNYNNFSDAKNYFKNDYMVAEPSSGELVSDVPKISRKFGSKSL